MNNSVDIFFNKVLFRFHVWKKKIKGDSPLLPGIHFCCCVCIAQQIINSLYIFNYLFRGRLLLFFVKKDLYWIYKYKDRM